MQFNIVQIAKSLKPIPASDYIDDYIDDDDVRQARG